MKKAFRILTAVLLATLSVAVLQPVRSFAEEVKEDEEVYEIDAEAPDEDVLAIGALAPEEAHPSETPYEEYPPQTAVETILYAVLLILGVVVLPAVLIGLVVFLIVRGIRKKRKQQ